MTHPKRSVHVHYIGNPKPDHEFTVNWLVEENTELTEQNSKLMREVRDLRTALAGFQDEMEVGL